MINSAKLLKSLALCGALFSLLVGNLTAAGADPRAPNVPEILQVPEGYRVSHIVAARGVQIYTATVSPTDPAKLVWTFVGPEAVLYDQDGDLFGFHFAYAGPTRPAWLSTSGSLIVGARTVAPVTVDPEALPWLILDVVHSEGHGPLDRVALIQRVNTTGGLAPVQAPTQLGEQVRVDYTADYVFYRQAPTPRGRSQH